jgi:hypothetical protein
MIQTAFSCRHELALAVQGDVEVVDVVSGGLRLNAAATHRSRSTIAAATRPGLAVRLSHANPQPLPLNMTNFIDLGKPICWRARRLKPDISRRSGAQRRTYLAQAGRWNGAKNGGEKSKTIPDSADKQYLKARAGSPPRKRDCRRAFRSRGPLISLTRHYGANVIGKEVCKYKSRRGTACGLGLPWVWLSLGYFT